MYKYDSGVLEKSLVLILLTHTPLRLSSASTRPTSPSSHASHVARSVRPFRLRSPRHLTFRIPSDFFLPTPDPPGPVRLRSLDFQPSGLPRTSVHLVLASSFPPRPSVTLSRHSYQSLVRPTCDSQVVNLPARLDFFVLPSRHVRTPVGVRS